MLEYNITSRRVWDDKEEPTMVDEIVEGKGKPRHLSMDLRNSMHDFVLDNASHLEPYRRNYEEIWRERSNARSDFRRRNPRRTGQRWVPYPSELGEIPPFSVWITKEVRNAHENGIVLPDEVVDSSRAPSLVARKFRSMYSYGYHYRVKSVEENVMKTCDSGVAAVFQGPCRSGRRDPNPVEASLEYVGQILEIVELNYGRHCTLLLVCEWVKANYRGRNVTVKKDEWGFTMANFNSLLPFGYESFAFPLHCDQVFFSDVEEERGWKIVLRNEVRGRRVDNAEEQGIESEMFRMGENEEHAGLCSTPADREFDAAPIHNGRNIQVNAVLGESTEEDAPVFDRDVGESSKED